MIHMNYDFVLGDAQLLKTLFRLPLLSLEIDSGNRIGQHRLDSSRICAMAIAVSLETFTTLKAQ